MAAWLHVVSEDLGGSKKKQWSVTTYGEARTFIANPLSASWIPTRRRSPPLKGSSLRSHPPAASAKGRRREDAEQQAPTRLIFSCGTTSSPVSKREDISKKNLREWKDKYCLRVLDQQPRLHTFAFAWPCCGSCKRGGSLNRPSRIERSCLGAERRCDSAANPRSYTRPGITGS